MFIVPYSLVYNRIYIIYISILLDLGANGFAFLDTRCAKDVMKFLGRKATPLGRPITAKGYDGVPGKPITHYLSLDLVIDRRRLVEIPFLILDLGNHDMILGAKWMSYFDIYPDLKRHKLIWPASLPQTSEKSFAKKIQVPRDRLQPQPVLLEHQSDVVRRQHLFDQQDDRNQAGKNSGRVSQILLYRDTTTIQEEAPPPTPGLIHRGPEDQGFPEPGLRNELPLPTIVPTCHSTNYASGHSQDLATMEASFRLAEIEELWDNA